MKNKEEIIREANEKLRFIKKKFTPVIRSVFSDETKKWIEELQIIDVVWYGTRDLSLVLDNGEIYTFCVHPVTLGRFTSHLTEGHITEYGSNKRWDFYQKKKLYYYDQNWNWEYKSDYFSEKELPILHLFFFELVEIAAAHGQEARRLEDEVDKLFR